MISDLSAREDELAGRTVLIVGMGAIGSRLARLARAFEMNVIGVRRNTAAIADIVDEAHAPDALASLWGRADFVVLTCPLTDETANIVDAAALTAMDDTAHLINVARGGCVDEPVLIEALKSGQIAGAGIDTTVEEPLSESSPLWGFDNVILTPHTAGETRHYEENVIDILLENLDRLWRGGGRTPQPNCLISSLAQASIDEVDPDPEQGDEQNALKARLRDTAAKPRSNPHADERGDEYGDRDQELIETEDLVGGKTKK